MRLNIYLILELQILLTNEQIQKPNLQKEWLNDTKIKITILKGYLSACSSVENVIFLPVEEKEPKKYINLT